MQGLHPIIQPSSGLGSTNPRIPSPSVASDSVYYYYSIMNDEDRKAYANIYQGLLSCADSVDPLTNDSLKLGSLYLAVLSDHPGIFWNASSFSYTQSSNLENCLCF